MTRHKDSVDVSSGLSRLARLVIPCHGLEYEVASADLAVALKASDFYMPHGANKRKGRPRSLTGDVVDGKSQGEGRMNSEGRMRRA